MKVRKRLQINVAVAVIAAVLIVLIGFLALTRVHRVVKESGIANEIVNSAFERNTFRNDYLRTSSERARVQWFAKSEQLSRLLQSASDTFQDADHKRTIDELVEDNESTVTIFSEIVKNRETARAGGVPAELSEETENRLVTQLNMRAYDRAIQTKQLRESAQEHLDLTLTRAVWSILFVIAVMTAAATINSWTIGRTIINRIGLLRDGSSVIGEGNLDHRIEIEGDDEFAGLSKAFNIMTEKLQASYVAREGEIEARKKTEGALKQNERELEMIIENAPACVKLVAEDGTLLKMNRAGLKIIEADSLGQVQGKSIYPLVAEQYRPAFIKLTREVYQGKAGTLEFEAVGLQGKALWLNVHGVPLYDNAGKITALLGITVDVTESKRAEEILRESEKRLKKSQEIAHLGSWELDLVNNHLTWTDEVYRIFGLRPQEFAATFEAFLEAVHPEDRAAVDAAYAGSLQEGKNAYEIEHRVLRKSTGEIRYVHEKCEHVRDASDRVVRSSGMVQDITERKRAEEDIKNLNEELSRNVRELESSNKEFEAFVYSVAHDLRAPLRAVSGYSQILLARYAGAVDEKGKNDISSIIHNAEQMNNIIDDLLRLSSISRHEIHKEDLDMSGILKKAAKELQEAQPGRRVAVDIKEGMLGFADARLMQVALLNLLGNAWKFTSRTAQANIECGSLKREGKTVYYVKDNGAGFDQSLAEKMFLPFHRLHSEQEFEGTGVGLAIVERVIRRHGGKIWAEGKKNEGAVIFFTLN